MGHSGAYGGSGGKWTGGQGDAAAFADSPNEDTADALAKAAIQALLSEKAAGAEGGGSAAPVDQVSTSDSTLPGLRAKGRGASGGGGDGAGGGTSGGGGSGGGSGGRSRAQTSRVGGRAIAAGFGLRSGNAALLAGLGLSLTALEGLPAFDQIQRILDEIVPASGDPREVELRAAARDALIVLIEEEDPSPEMVVEVYVRECVFDAAMTEYAEGFGEGLTAAESEQLLKDTIDAYTRQIDLPDKDYITSADFEAAINEVLEKIGGLVE